jgi:hypothetical protein
MCVVVTTHHYHHYHHSTTTTTTTKKEKNRVDQVSGLFMSRDPPEGYEGLDLQSPEQKHHSRGTGPGSRGLCARSILHTRCAGSR